jgi:hypothetical protein
LLPKIVITGFNTDIEHEGVVYHVQTEDKGLESPLILSLVYSGGAILASKRSPYDDLIAVGFNEGELANRLKRQHRLICAAIHAGRIDDLKRMGARAEQQQEQAEEQGQDLPLLGADQFERTSGTTATEEPPIQDQWSELLRQETDQEAPAPVSSSVNAAYTVHDPRRQSPLGEVVEVESGLVVSVLDEQEFRSGGSFTLRVLVKVRSGDEAKPIGGVPVSVKILGTTFRPQIYSVKTQRDGVAVTAVEIPQFASGRAAILIRAEAGGSAAELRRVIQAGK